MTDRLITCFIVLILIFTSAAVVLDVHDRRAAACRLAWAALGLTALVAVIV